MFMKPFHFKLVHEPGVGYPAFWESFVSSALDNFDFQTMLPWPRVVNTLRVDYGAYLDDSCLIFPSEAAFLVFKMRWS